MNNFNVLSIPITKKPETPPVPGQCFVYFTARKELMSLDSNNVEQRLHLKKYTEQIALTESFAIQEVRNPNTIVLDGDQTSKISNGDILVTKGSTNGSNDKLIVANNVSVEGGNTIVSLDNATLTPGLAELGEAHIPKDVAITHRLGTTSITFSLVDGVTGDGEIRVNFQVQDENTLLLKPEVAIPGSLSLTIIG